MTGRVVFVRTNNENKGEELMNAFKNVALYAVAAMAMSGFGATEADTFIEGQK